MHVRYRTEVVLGGRHREWLGGCGGGGGGGWVFRVGVSVRRVGVHAGGRVQTARARPEGMWGRGNRGGRAWGLYGRGGGWRTQIGRGSDPGRVVARGVRSRIAASGVRARRGKGKGGLAAKARAIDPDCHLGLHAPSIRQIAIHGYHSSHREPLAEDRRRDGHDTTLSALHPRRDALPLALQ